MTTQPDRPFAADDELEEHAGPEVSSAFDEESGGEESGVVVAEVIDEQPFSQADDMSDGTEPSPVNAATGQAGEPGKGALGQQWHDIQAMFVDDPRGSVQLAAEAADAAVSSLVESLHERQARLGPAAGAANDTDRFDTEQLRETLREYRVFCEAVRDLGRRVPQASNLAR